MKIQEIMAVLKNLTSIPATQTSDKLKKAIKFCSSDIKSVFFNNDSSSDFLRYNKDSAQDPLNELAVKYVTWMISLCDTRNFNKTVTGISIDKINDWFNSNGNTVGLWYMLDYLLYDMNLSGILDNPQESLNELVSNGTDDIFINGFMSECHEVQSYIPAKMYLHLLNMLDNSGDSTKTVIAKWSTHGSWNTIQDYDSYNWFYSVNNAFCQNSSIYDEIKSSVFNALNVRTDHKFNKREVIDTTITGAPIVGNVPYCRHTYGEKAWNWIQSGSGPSRYSMKSNEVPKNIEDEKIGGSPGCVLKGTLIRMIDGSTKPIEKIQPGDEVINGIGTVSVCSKEIIHNPHITKMYSINNNELYMSLEHALMTDRGWCSADPNHTKEVNPDVNVNHLEIGDNVWKFLSCNDGSLKIEKETVRSIQYHTAENEPFEGYDIHFSEGYDSYFANDYLCLLSYPDVTIENILLNIKKNMTKAEEAKFWDIIKDNESIFRKVFGNASIENLLYRNH